MLSVPKLFLQQSVKVEKLKGKNAYGDPEYAEPLNIENIKIDTKTTFSGSGSDRKINKETTLFIYLSSQAKDFVIDDSFLEARVTDSGQNQFVLKEYAPNKNPIKDEVWSYEVRLI
ncbi:putative minor capsid protein [Lactococcus sp.]|uniref:putative minor capsid protein n=1 Tax=Lactococcus sp. TaxID=44273 RepID=UPI002FCB961D